MAQKVSLGPVEIRVLCSICGESLSESRIKQKSRVCSEKCKDRLDFIHAKLRESNWCPYCLHPSTPDERLKYREWRATLPKAKGDRKSLKSIVYTAREQQLAHKNDLVTALRKANLLLAAQAESLVSSYASPAKEGEAPDPQTITDALARDEYEVLTKAITRNNSLLDRSAQK